jgi:hypothetical protein
VQQLSTAAPQFVKPLPPAWQLGGTSVALHAPEAQNGVGPPHAMASLHAPASVHASTPFPEHRVALGTQTAEPPSDASEMEAASGAGSSRMGASASTSEAGASTTGMTSSPSAAASGAWNDASTPPFAAEEDEHADAMGRSAMTTTVDGFRLIWLSIRSRFR